MNDAGGCSYCGQQNVLSGLLKCGRCKSEFYCSKVCQKQHWKKGHKERCKAASVQGKGMFNYLYTCTYSL